MSEHRPSHLVGQDVGAALAEDRTRWDLGAVDLVLHRGPVRTCRVILRKTRLEAELHAKLGQFCGHHLAEGCPATMLKRVTMGGCVHGSPLPICAKGRLHDPDMDVNVGFTGLVFDMDEYQG